MHILEGTDVDVLTPFPPAYWGHASRWMHRQRTMIFGDGAPEAEPEIAAWLRDRAERPGIETFAVVDKNNLLRLPEGASLVGVIFFEPAGPQNAYAHVTACRRAWGRRLVQPGLIEQGSELTIQHVFSEHTALQRLSVATFANNHAAQGLARRMGFVQDGYFRAMETYRGRPMDVVHFGRLRASTEREQTLLVDTVPEQQAELAEAA